MPYRRLPTTDKARIRAMEAAVRIASERGGGNLAFSKNTLFELNTVKVNFENHLKHHELDLKLEGEKNAEYKHAYEKARIYIAHFIQVLYMNIEREELKEDVLSFYDLQDYGKKLPSLASEKEVIEWGQRMIQGEQQRMQRRGSPIYNPSIALVRVKVEEFQEIAIFQNNLKRNTLRSYDKLQQLRKATNEFISRMWTEIEESMPNLEVQQKRQMCQEYGIVYVLRRNERKKLESEGIQVDLSFDFD